MKTTLYTVLCVAIRLGAVFMAVGLLERGFDIFFYPSQDGHCSAGALWLEGAGLLVAFALWLWPNILVWWAIGRNRHEVLESSIDANQLQYIALSVLGASLFVSSMSACLGHFVLILITLRHSAYDGAPNAVPATEWHWMIQYAATAAGGGALALGSRGLVGLLHRLRGYTQSADRATDHGASFTQDD
jgi:hypothetical protein